MKIAFYTLGCKVNQFETEKLITDFTNKGYIIGNFDEICDVYLINTCSVTALADKKSRQIARRAKRLNTKAIIVMCGCSVEGKNEIELEYADIVIGNKDKTKIPDMVDKLLNFNPTNIKLSDTITSTKTRALIKIEDGCNNFCSYCIIPYLRGRVTSIPYDEIIDYAKKLGKSGFLEVVLTGIHITSYNDNRKTLIDILEKLETIDEIKRIRLGSLEPMYITKDIAKRLGNLTKLCEHFHISLQSGSDTVLSRMNRKYTTKEYESEIKLLREHIKNVSITTDVITGFVGETQEEMEQTLEFIEKIKFSKIHIFPYSRREGTKAYDMKEQIPKDIKTSRAKEISVLDKKQHQEYLNQSLNKIVEVLIETITDNGYYEGYSKNYIKVYVKSPINVINKIINIKLSELMLDGVCGYVV